MKTELILDVGELLHMTLLTTFNYFLVEGFPEALSTEMVHALFKGGDASELDNYSDAPPSSLLDPKRVQLC
jgi:hypothetical protein